MTITEIREFPQDPAVAAVPDIAHSAQSAQTALEDAAIFRGWATDYYEAEALRHYDAAVARMLQHLDPPPGSVVLDAGCGTGVHAARLARAGFTVCAVDISPPALELASQHAAELGLQRRILIRNANLTQLPFAEGEFPAAYSWGVLAHIEEVDQALRELVRVVRAGGRIALQVTNHRAWDHVVEAAARFVCRRPQAFHRSQWGMGWWSETEAGRLWTWRLNVEALVQRMAQLGCRLVARGPSEFTELQRRVQGWPRIAMRRLNDAWFNLRLPAGPACTNLLVFEKRAG